MNTNIRLCHLNSKEALDQFYVWAKAFLEQDSSDKKISDTMVNYIKEMYNLILSELDTVITIKQLAGQDITDEDFSKQVKIIFNSFNQEF